MSIDVHTIYAYGHAHRLDGYTYDTHLQIRMHIQTQMQVHTQMHIHIHILHSRSTHPGGYLRQMQFISVSLAAVSIIVLAVC